MSGLIKPSRRGLLQGLFGLTVASPAVIKLPGLLMPIRPYRENTLLTINEITRQAIRLWKNNNIFIQNLDLDAKYGSLRIKLPPPDWSQT